MTDIQKLIFVNIFILAVFGFQIHRLGYEEGRADGISSSFVFSTCTLTDPSNMSPGLTTAPADPATNSIPLNTALPELRTIDSVNGHSLGCVNKDCPANVPPGP